MSFVRPSGRVLGLRVDRVDYDQAVAAVFKAAEAQRSFRVAAANVHLVMEAHDDPELAKLLERFELVVPDGQPLRWVLNARGNDELVDRVYGPELMRRTVARAAIEHVPVFLYGATAVVLEALSNALVRAHPSLEIAGMRAPGFGDALFRDAEADVAFIRASGARIVFVGLGCPRQERWLGLHGAALDMPSLAVGAAFDLLAGAKRMAPPMLQRNGLEWAYRLVTEPKRTWRRYLVQNPRFVVGLVGEVLGRGA